MSNFNKFSTNLINNNIENFPEDSSIRKLQTNLIMMGFDITMVNKVISYFKIRTVDEALDYLIKTDDGFWNHPFIPKEEIKGINNNRILEQPKLMVNNIVSKISGSVNIIGSLNGSEQNENKIDYKIENDICEICGELKEFHKIKDYEINLYKNNNIFNIENNNINNLYIINSHNEDNINENNKIQINIQKNNNILVDDEDEKEDKKEEINPNKCPICMDDFEEPVEIENCKHKFCYECFNLYLVNLINNNNIDKIPCPKKNCSNKELSENFFSQYLSEQEYFKYRQFKSQNEIARDAKKFFCPHCNSYAEIQGNIDDYDSNNPNYKKSILQCKNGHNFCSCGRPIHENDCFQDEKEFKELIANEEIKKCPKCGFLIKKNRGCNHMTCGNPLCKYEFCWLCMNEAVPGHYEFGPCAGRQFFDPNSFSYYMEQNYPILSHVYEFFAGIFTLLGLIISLVAVPGIGLTIFSFGIIFFEDVFSREIKSNFIKIILFQTYFCLSFALQSVVYLFWGIVIFIINIIFYLFLIQFGIRIIFKGCGFCFFQNTSNNQIELEILEERRNFENNEIEMANSINEEQ